MFVRVVPFVYKIDWDPRDLHSCPTRPSSDLGPGDEPAPSVYDPMDPAPTLGGPILMAAIHGSGPRDQRPLEDRPDRKRTRLNSSNANISYAVFCLKK